MCFGFLASTRLVRSRSRSLRLLSSDNLVYGVIIQTIANRFEPECLCESRKVLTRAAAGQRGWLVGLDDVSASGQVKSRCFSALLSIAFIVLDCSLWLFLSSDIQRYCMVHRHQCVRDPQTTQMQLQSSIGIMHCVLHKASRGPLGDEQLTKIKNSHGVHHAESLPCSR